MTKEKKEGLGIAGAILYGIILVPNFVLSTFFFDIIKGTTIGAIYLLVMVFYYRCSTHTCTQQTLGQTLVLQSVAVLMAVVLSFPHVGMISILLIQGFLWASSTPYLMHDSSEYKRYTSVDALKLLFKKVSNISRQFAQLGMLGVTGTAVVLGAAILSFSDKSIFPETQLVYLAIATAYFTIMFLIGILRPLEVMKKEIICRIEDIDKSKKKRSCKEQKESR